MTIPATQDIAFTRGDSWDLFFRVKGRDAVGDLVYLDLTGCTATAQIRSTLSSPTIQATITCTISNQTTLKGGVYCRLEDSVTSSMNPGQSVWDVEIKWPGVNGDRKTVLAGTVTITADVTHA